MSADAREARTKALRKRVKKAVRRHQHAVRTEGQEDEGDEGKEDEEEAKPLKAKRAKRS